MLVDDEEYSYSHRLILSEGSIIIIEMIISILLLYCQEYDFAD